MLVPVQITFRDMHPSEAIEAGVRGRVEQLERVFDRMTSCHVTIEKPHRHQHQGRLFHVHIDVILPGGEVVVGRDASEHHANVDPHVAVRDAFDVLRRRLEDHVRRQRGAVKTHAVPEREVG